MTFISKDLAAEIQATKLQYSNEFHDDNDIDEDSIEIPRRMRYNCNDERRCKNEQSERD